MLTATALCTLALVAAEPGVTAPRAPTLADVVALGREFPALPDGSATTTTGAAPAPESAARPMLAAPSGPSSPLTSLWLFVAGLAALLVVVLARRPATAERGLRVVEAVTVGRGQRIAVVDVGGARMLVGTSERGITVLKDRVDYEPRPGRDFRATLLGLLGGARGASATGPLAIDDDDARLASSEEDELRHAVDARRRMKGGLALVGGME